MSAGEKYSHSGWRRYVVLGTGEEFYCSHLMSEVGSRTDDGFDFQYRGRTVHYYGSGRTPEAQMLWLSHEGRPDCVEAKLLFCVEGGLWYKSTTVFTPHNKSLKAPWRGDSAVEAMLVLDVPSILQEAKAVTDKYLAGEVR